MTFLAGLFGASQPVSADNHWIIRSMGAKTNAGVSVSESSALTFPAVYAAVNLLSSTVAQLPLALFQKNGRGADIVSEHPLCDVLRLKPNDFMTAFHQRQTVQHHVVLWGNGYMEIERNGRGETVGLYPLLPDRTRPTKKAGEALSYTTTIDSRQFVLPAENVAHVKALGFDGYCGISPLAMFRQAVGLGLAMEEFGGKFFANDAKSGGFLQHPGKLSEPAQKNLADSINAQGGLDKAHRVKVLEEGMKFVSTTIPPEDAQFLSSREFQVAEIARIYGIPGPLIGSMEKTSSWGSGIEQLMIGFVQWTMQPWLIQWEQELTLKLLTQAERDDEMFIKFNINALLRGDMASRSNFYNRAINDGWMTRNEVRAKEDLNPLEGLDDPLVPLNMTTAGDEPAAQDATDEPPMDAAITDNLPETPAALAASPD